MRDRALTPSPSPGVPGEGRPGAFMQAIKDYYVAGTAIVTGSVVLNPGVNIWFGTIIRGDVSKTASSRDTERSCMAHASAAIR